MISLCFSSLPLVSRSRKRPSVNPKRVYCFLKVSQWFFIDREPRLCDPPPLAGTRLGGVPPRWVPPLGPWETRFFFAGQVSKDENYNNTTIRHNENQHSFQLPGLANSVSLFLIGFVPFAVGRRWGGAGGGCTKQKPRHRFKNGDIFNNKSNCTLKSRIFSRRKKHSIGQQKGMWRTH